MIPSRIDERKRDMPTSEDWDTLEKELESKKKALEDIEQQLIDASKAAEVSNQHKMTLIKEAGKIQEKKAERQFKIKEDILAEYRQQQSARNKLVSAISAEESTIATLKTRIQEYDNSLVKLAQDREYLISEWNSINAEQLTFNEDEFICPTCKRRFEVHEIESRQQEISETFLKNKSERLERNKQAGMGIRLHRYTSTSL